MNIEISLFSEQSIQNAIDKLHVRLHHLKDDTEQLVDILAEEGADVASGCYAGYPVAVNHYSSGNESQIVANGEEPLPMIAEFGAGDQTLDVGFENTPAEAYAGSWSEEHKQQYSRWGFWYFGGNVYYEVYPRHGLLDAKRYIINHSTETAKEVMTYD